MTEKEKKKAPWADDKFVKRGDFSGYVEEHLQNNPEMRELIFKVLNPLNKSDEELGYQNYHMVIETFESATQHAADRLEELLYEQRYFEKEKDA